MAGDIKAKYGSNGQSITCTIGNNPTGTIAQHGRISNAVDNSSNVFLDAFLFVKIKTGGSTPSANKQALVYALGTADGGATYTDGFTIGDADSVVVVNTARLIGVIRVAVSGTIYYGGPWSMAAAFGGSLPDHWGIYVFNDSGQTWSTTNADFSVFYQGVYATFT